MLFLGGILLSSLDDFLFTTPFSTTFTSINPITYLLRHVPYLMRFILLPNSRIREIRKRGYETTHLDLCVLRIDL